MMAYFPVHLTVPLTEQQEKDIVKLLLDKKELYKNKADVVRAAINQFINKQ